MRTILFLLLLPVLLWAKAPLLGVSELTPHGISESDAAIITERLRSELLQTRMVRVLERAEMDKVLKEQAFQNSGACEASRCASEIGKLLSVDRMVVGTVGKIGELYTLNVRLVDVGSGEVLVAVNEDNPGGRLESVLTKSVPRLADKLITAMLEGKSGPDEIGSGDLYVTLEDSTATLFLDGLQVQGSRLFSLEKVEAGTHLLVARTATQFGAIEVSLMNDDVQHVEIPLINGTGMVKFLSDPMGAQVFVERQLVGETPFKSGILEVGNRKALFRKEGYFDTTVPVGVSMDEQRSVKVNLRPAGSLALDPPVEIPLTLTNGTETLTKLGDKPVLLRPGTWRVQASHPDWRYLDTTVTIRKGKLTTVPLHRYHARLSIIAKPKAEVWLDGKPIGPTPHILDTVEPGAHVLRLRCVGYKDIVKPFVAAIGEVLLERFTLESQDGRVAEHRPKRTLDD